MLYSDDFADPNAPQMMTPVDELMPPEEDIMGIEYKIKKTGTAVKSVADALREEREQYLAETDPKQSRTMQRR